MPVMTTCRAKQTQETFSGQTTFFGRVRQSHGCVELVMSDGTAVALTGCRAGLGRDRGEVEVEGLATWDAKTSAPLSIRVTRSRHRPSMGVDKIFERLALAAGSHWGDVDARSHVQRIRGEDK